MTLNYCNTNNRARAVTVSLGEKNFLKLDELFFSLAGNILREYLQYYSLCRKRRLIASVFCGLPF